MRGGYPGPYLLNRRPPTQPAGRVAIIGQLNLEADGMRVGDAAAAVGDHAASEPGHYAGAPVVFGRAEPGGPVFTTLTQATRADLELSCRNDGDVVEHGQTVLAVCGTHIALTRASAPL